MTLLKNWWIVPLGMILVALILIIWFLPLQGTVLVSNQRLDPRATFPQYLFDPATPRPGEEVLVTITDNVPWTHVSLTVNDEPAHFVQTQALPLRQLWSWTWRIQSAPHVGEQDTDEPVQTVLAFYRDCNSGCRLRDQRALEPYVTASQALPQPMGTPTKLCVAFPDPNRNWHGRSGWVTDLTYAQSETSYWQIDALAQRVQQNRANSHRVLLRVDYAPDQSLPPTNDDEALALYLAHLQQLVRDQRLSSVYGYIIGASFNTPDSNLLSPENPTTPAWYAQLLNGPQTADLPNNVIRIVRANSSTARVLVGAVRPWTTTQNGEHPYKPDAPWLNYMNSLVKQLDENSVQNLSAGIPLTTPDGFALNVPGRPDLLDNEEIPRASEPTLAMPQAAWDGAQAGFQVYREWLAIINSYPTTRGKPAFITATNTFAPDNTVSESTVSDNAVPDNTALEARLPAQNYPSGWLTNALNVINQEPQIESLCWFLDRIPGDQRWQGFSLAQQQSRMKDAAQEFDQLLQE